MHPLSFLGPNGQTLRSRPHPERRPGEVLLGNHHPRELAHVPWRSRRLGRQALGAYGEPTEGTGPLVPVFVAEEEVRGAGITVYEVPYLLHFLHGEGPDRLDTRVAAPLAWLGTSEMPGTFMLYEDTVLYCMRPGAGFFLAGRGGWMSRWGRRKERKPGAGLRALSASDVHDLLHQRFPLQHALFAPERVDEARGAAR